MGVSARPSQLISPGVLHDISGSAVKATAFSVYSKIRRWAPSRTSAQQHQQHQHQLAGQHSDNKAHVSLPARAAIQSLTTKGSIPASGTPCPPSRDSPVCDTHSSTPHHPSALSVSDTFTNTKSAAAGAVAVAAGPRGGSSLNPDLMYEPLLILSEPSVPATASQPSFTAASAASHPQPARILHCSYAWDSSGGQCDGQRLVAAQAAVVTDCPDRCISSMLNI